MYYLYYRRTYFHTYTKKYKIINLSIYIITRKRLDRFHNFFCCVCNCQEKVLMKEILKNCAAN